MRMSQAFLPLAAAALLVTGCSNKHTAAQTALGSAEGAIETVKEEAALYAPEELKAAEATVGEMKAKFTEREYADVVAKVPEFNTQLELVQATIVSKQTTEVASIKEWQTLNQEVPESVEALQARVDSLQGGKLPKEVSKESFETAKSELATLKATWAEAQAAANAGRNTEAADKGRTAQSKAEALKSQLGMNPTVAGM